MSKCRALEPSHPIPTIRGLLLLGNDVESALAWYVTALLETRVAQKFNDWWTFLLESLRKLQYKAVAAWIRERCIYSDHGAQIAGAMVSTTPIKHVLSAVFGILDTLLGRHAPKPREEYKVNQFNS